MVDVQDLIPTLLREGVLAPAEALGRRVELVSVGRSHPVFRLDLDGRPAAAAKLFGERRGETDGEAEREAAVYALRDDMPALAELLPRLLAARPDAGLFVTAWFDGLPAWDGDALTGATDRDAVGGDAVGGDAVGGDAVGGDAVGGDAAADLETLARRVAAPLAALHRDGAKRLRDGTLDARLAAPCPWALRVFDGDAPAELWRHPTVAPVLARAGTRPALVRGVRRARGAWRPVTLIHGDLKHDNVLIASDGGVAVVDWEMARIGDPAWDLAGLMARPLLGSSEAAWGAANEAAAVRMVAAYAAAARLSLPALAQRLVLYCGVWLLMSLLQSRSVAPETDDAATERLLGRASATFGDCDRLVARLVEAADAA
jgi:hypothetical protein